MGVKGLCGTCVQERSCIFVKDPPVFLCEEFSCGTAVPTDAGKHRGRGSRARERSGHKR